MNKKEVSEIKKLFTPQKCAITRICGCYVDGEKNKKTEIKESFLSLPEEEEFKYFSIFKSTLSGTLGKNLINMEFPHEQENSVDGTQSFLLKLRDSELKDDSLISEFYDKVIASYGSLENYYIILIHGAYDIPCQTTDGETLEDASDYVYSFIMCSLCPVKRSKAVLCYNENTNTIENRLQDWIVDNPNHGFLFPAFNERNTDIHSLLYYTKNSETMMIDFIDALLGCYIPMTYKSQQETFKTVVEETLGNECDFNSVMSIHEELRDIVEEAKEKEVEEPVAIDKPIMKKILEHSGVSNEKIKALDATFEDNAPKDTPILATNVATTRAVNIETPDVSIRVKPDKTHLVENRVIDGIPYILIQATDDVTLNGIKVRTLLPDSEERTED